MLEPARTRPSPLVLPTPGPWRRAIFVHRPNRFVVRARITSGGGEVRAHLPDPGRLTELLVPGRSIWLKAADRSRKTRWTAVYVVPEEGGLVCCDTRRPNQLAAAALRGGAIAALSQWSVLRSEATWGSSRFDFLLGQGAEGSTWRRRGSRGSRRAWPASPTPSPPEGRGTCGSWPKWRQRLDTTPAVLFLMQRSGPVRRIEAAADRDPEFAAALAAARSAGVLVLGYQTRMTLDATELGSPVPVVG